MKNVLHSSETNEWYTPTEYIEAARAVMGSIDLDPASSRQANETVKAGRFFDKLMNGLEHEWWGNVFLNPPYGKISGRSNQDIWSERLIREYECKAVKQAILIINAVPDRKWFARLWHYPICFTRTRIKFNSPLKIKAKSPTHGSAIVYMGDQLTVFNTVFSVFGHIVWPDHLITISRCPLPG